MRQLQVNDCVRLIHGVPNDFLPAGSVGVIQCTWGEPEPDYEVEFRLLGRAEIAREVLKADQIELVEKDIPDLKPLSDDTTSWDRYENEVGQIWRYLL